MSELIDRIYDVEKISAEVLDVLKEIGKTTAAIDWFKTSVEELEKATRKAKGVEELKENSKALNDIVVKGGVEMKRYEAEVAKLNEKTKQLTTSDKEAAIAIAKARLELAAASKATKEAAIAQIELDGKTQHLAGSYNALQQDLKNATRDYKALSAAEREGAKGRELLGKIQETQKSLKDTDASMGNFQRNVGNYGSALDGLTPRLGGLAGTLLDIAKGAKENAKNWGEMGNNTNMGIQSMGQAPAGLAKITAGFKGLGQVVMAVGKAVLANPIVAVVAAIILIFKQVANAIAESEERTNKMSEAFARLKPILRTIGDIFEVVADVIVKTVEWIGKATAAVLEFIGINPKGSADQFVAAEKLKQKAVQDTRRLNEESSKSEAIIEEQREKIADKEAYTFEQRAEALRIAQKEEKKLSDARLKMSELNLKALKAEAALDDNNAAMNDKLSAAIVAVTNARRENATIGRKLAKEQQKLIKENEADLKAEADAAKAAADKILAARRRLIDSQIELMSEGEQKTIALAKETFNRQIEDLRRNGELTKALLKNLTEAQNKELEKINNEFRAKDLNDKIKADELVLDNMKKAGDDTLQFEKKLLEQRMQAEILAGGSEFEIREKYRYLVLDLEAKTSDERIALFQKEVERTAAIMTEGYSEEERALKKQFSKGLISREQYEKALSDLQLDALLKVNQASIDALRTQLANAELTTDKRAELSKKLRDLEIANEEAITDAVIAENDKQLAAEEAGKQKRIQLIGDIANAAGEIFGAIADFQNQKSEQRIQELEKEQELVDENFEKSQENLDGAIMSEEARAEKQKQLNEEKAAADKAIADKVQAEKIKQAKWDKANSLVQAIINGGLAVLNASLAPPPLGFIFAGLAATLAGIQIATIASQQIPAFADGGITQGGPVLWGEVRPEIAVDPSGNVMLATKPTVSAFDAGTQIYKSVDDYNSKMAAKGKAGFSFDYDRMAEKMPQQVVNFDSRGLVVVSKKTTERTKIINRRYKLGN